MAWSASEPGSGRFQRTVLRPMLLWALALCVGKAGGAGEATTPLRPSGSFERCLRRGWMAPGAVLPHLNFTVWKPDDVRHCLGSFKISLHDMMVTMENLYLGVATIYSFTPIVKNSTASLQKTRCGLDVHPISVDLVKELDTIYGRFVEPAAKTSRLDQLKEENVAPFVLADILTEPTSMSALDFHSALNELFARLRDAHTTYTMQSAMLQVLPVDFSLRAGEDGKVEVLAEHSAITTQTLGLEKHNVRLLSKQRPRAVESINGLEPLVFLQRLADRQGTFLDAGQRLNNLVLGKPLLESLPGSVSCVVAASCDLVPKGDTAISISFKSGEQEIVDWVVALHPGLASRAFVTGNPVYMFLEKQTQLKEMWHKERNDACSELADCSVEELRKMVAPRQTNALRAYRRLLSNIPEKDLSEALAHTAERALSAFEVADEVDSRGFPLAPKQANVYRKKRGRQLQRTSRFDPARFHLPGHEPTHTWKLFQLPGDTDGDDDDDSADDNSTDRSNGETNQGSGEFNVDDIVDPAIAAFVTEEVTTCLMEQANVSDEKGLASSLEVVHVGTDSQGAEWVTVLRVGDMMVFKLQTMGDDPFLFYMFQAMYAWRELVKYAKGKGVKRLLLDIIQNGGGLVALSDLLQSLILKDTDSKSLCNLYDKRLAPYWRAWVESYGQGIDHSVQEQMRVLRLLAAKKSFEAVQMYAHFQALYIRGLMGTSNLLMGHAFGCNATELNCCEDGTVVESCKANVIVDLSLIDHWIGRIQRASSTEELLAIMEATLPKHEFIPKILFGGTTVDALNETSQEEPSGWFPFTGDELLEPDTLKPWPHMKGIRESIRQQWGGTSTHVTQKGIFQTCPQLMPTPSFLQEAASGGLPNLTDYVDHPFTDVAFLTDGLTGSAASALPSRLLASGYVTAFSYGGFGSSIPMDTSGFAGGNVLSYDEWWPRVALAAEIGMWLLPHRPWEELSRDLNLTHYDISSGDRDVLYPYPMPFRSTSARFNFNMMYVKEFAAEGDETMLPRQFYRLPAHKQYDIWPKSLAASCGNPVALLTLYRQISGEDWFALRRNPQFLDMGWSSACVPDEHDRACCTSASFSAESRLDQPATIAGEFGTSVSERASDVTQVRDFPMSAHIAAGSGVLLTAGLCMGVVLGLCGGWNGDNECDDDVDGSASDSSAEEGLRGPSEALIVSSGSRRQVVQSAAAQYTLVPT
eukprot:TRINITY_DN31762_c0_g1_i1.p1 TRINITY_DN31762_c0_g1~~TRINITY_DN31762_c0_g1_i1.p1  ORF type:complete len:1206 (+),score=142.17 TRINITY_DN31762_c0_g1_i1:101-3718(+)